MFGFISSFLFILCINIKAFQTKQKQNKTLSKILKIPFFMLSNIRMETLVEKVADNNVDNRDIIRRIQRLVRGQITNEQLNNQQMTIELFDWCEKNSELPFYEDKPFVIGSKFNVNREKSTIDRINIVISTKRLLNLALKRPDILICDSTYKFVWQGFSVIVAGTVDFAKKFHPIVIAINETEKPEDHKFLLDAIRRCILKLHKVEYKPEYYLADAGDSSKNGFTHVYTEPFKRVVYWSNAIAAIKQKLWRIKDANHRKLIKEDIYRIRSSQNEHIFAKAVLLFESKWRGKYDNQEVDEFVDYFKSKWCSDRNCGWYEGYSICQPIVDRFKAKSRVMKPNHVNKDMSVSEFLIKIVGETEGAVTKWSTDRNPYNNNNIKFLETPIYSLVNETFAWKWEQNGKEIRSIDLNGEEIYFTRAGEETKLESSECLDFMRDLITLPFDSFDELFTQTQKIHAIRLNKENWKRSFCSCSGFMSNLICDHIIAVAVRRNLHEFDPRAKQTRFCYKRKRDS